MDKQITRESQEVHFTKEQSKVLGNITEYIISQIEQLDIKDTPYDYFRILRNWYLMLLDYVPYIYQDDKEAFDSCSAFSSKEYVRFLAMDARFREIYIPESYPVVKHYITEAVKR